tara:strand:- start:285 stop:677 length:393 start_codon:yes stop_codon:yes gene_type:complete
MTELKKLYDDIPRGHVKDGRILYRGFSIKKEESGEIIIQDIRTPMFGDVNKEDLSVLKQRGFLKGATYLLMLSDENKINIYKKLIARTQRSAKNSDNSRKRQEFLNRVDYYKNEVEYYSAKVRRWAQILN